MSSNKAKRHVHKYYRANLPIGRLWACALPNCSHYMPEHIEKLVEGRSSYCWDCGNLIILDPINMKMDKPLCMECRTGEKENEIPLSNKLREFIERK